MENNTIIQINYIRQVIDVATKTIKRYKELKHNLSLNLTRREIKKLLKVFNFGSMSTCYYCLVFEVDFKGCIYCPMKAEENKGEEEEDNNIRWQHILLIEN